MRFAWTEGPTTGKTYEHSFREDGTVDFHEVTPGAGTVRQEVGGRQESGTAPNAKKKPIEYGAFRVTDDVFIVSYLSNEGYTLTVALNFDDSSMAGFASGAKEWFPLKGTFTVIE
jgi:hypothetical protein